MSPSTTEKYTADINDIYFLNLLAYISPKNKDILLYNILHNNIVIPLQIYTNSII